MKNLSLKVRLFTLAAVAMVALVIVGAVGWLGLSNTAEAMQVIGKVSLPSVRGLGLIQEAKTSIQSANRKVAFFEKDYKSQDQYGVILMDRNDKWHQVDEGWNIYESLPRNEEEEALWKKFVKEWADWKAADARVAETISELSHNTGEAQQKALFVEFYKRSDEAVPLYDKAAFTLDKLIDLNVEAGDLAVEGGEKSVSKSRVIMLSCSLAMLAILLLQIVWITRSILAQLGGEPAYVAEVVKRVAVGDLTVVVETKAKDTSSMLYGIKDMVSKLTDIVKEVRGTTESITNASLEIAQGNADLSQRTEEQASSLEETASSMEELTSTVRHNSENAKQANQLAANASDIAVKGGRVVGDVVHTMASISDSSKKIVDIISVIDSIAFQTNILALNAAVEAARAGEQGRGFAVVAGEVRNRAQRSAAAAKEIKGLINDSVNKVDAGTRQVDQAGATMNEIVQAVKRVTDIMAEIAAASNEQGAGIEQVNQAITQMDDVTQQNAALVEEAAAAAEAMQEQAHELYEAVGTFRVVGGREAAERYAAKVAALRANRPAAAQHAETPVRIGNWRQMGKAEEESGGGRNDLQLLANAKT